MIGQTRWWSELITEPYPPVAVFDKNQPITDSELFRFVRIILTEGVPFACAKFPMAYEFARQRAAERLGIDPKQVSLVGSARIGYSLATEKFGQAFDLSKSDIDLFAVSDELFKLLVEEHELFVESWDRGKIRPHHNLEKLFWENNRKIDPNNIRRGFLDASHIPTWDQFPIAQKIGDSAYRFHVNLEAKSGTKIGKRASIRVYQNWDSAIRQITFTLKGNLEKEGIQFS